MFHFCKTTVKKEIVLIVIISFKNFTFYYFMFGNLIFIIYTAYLVILWFVEINNKILRNILVKKLI